MRRVYLDHQAATPVIPEVWQEMQPWFAEYYGNPSSLHEMGLRARDAMANARRQAARFLKADREEEILFTSGGTESVNLAVKGAAIANQNRGNHIIMSDTEHPAVTASLDELVKGGFEVTRIPVDGEGRIDPEDIAKAITSRTILVCVHHVNNDIGVIEPIAEIGTLTAGRGIPFFVDATASGGWQPIDIKQMGASLVALSPHRFYGPKGVGILYRSSHTRLAGLIHGGRQEHGLRAGTENVPAIVGAGKACEAADRDMQSRREHVMKLQALLWAELQQNTPRLQLNGPNLGPERISNNLNVSVAGVEGEALLLRCDLSGLSLSAGASCISRALRIPHVFKAIGADPARAQSAIVLSPGFTDNEEDILYAAGIFAKAARHLRNMSPSWD